jgi:ATP-dependent RNA helicase RhlE
MSSSQNSSFAGFGLSEPLLRGVAAAGFTAPRPIQQATIPAAREGRDVLGLAQTGTGKTAAFALPLMERLLSRPGRGPRALVVAPTRELARQIEAEVRLLGRFTRIQTATVYGGVSERTQIAALRRRPDIVIACPGRLLDLHRQGHVELGRVEALVLDEADHMFDMGFLPDVRRILAALPAKRQNLLFSATMPSAVRHLADSLLRDAQVVELAHAAPVSTIDHGLYPVHEKSKLELLKHLLEDERPASAIVFTRTKHRARRLAEQLGRSGHRSAALQGNMSQSQRDRAMRDFRGGRFDILVATDIAARGIDVTRVSHVINFDVPTTPETYTHRIGRTGRAEREGRAFTFVTRDDREMVRAIERMIGEPIRRCEVPGFTERLPAAPLGGPRPAAARGQGASRPSGDGTGDSRRGAGPAGRGRGRRGRGRRGASGRSAARGA